MFCSYHEAAHDCVSCFVLPSHAMSLSVSLFCLCHFLSLCLSVCLSVVFNCTRGDSTGSRRCQLRHQSKPLHLGLRAQSAERASRGAADRLKLVTLEYKYGRRRVERGSRPCESARRPCHLNNARKASRGRGSSDTVRARAGWGGWQCEPQHGVQK